MTSLRTQTDPRQGGVTAFYQRVFLLNQNSALLVLEIVFASFTYLPVGFSIFHFRINLPFRVRITSLEIKCSRNLIEYLKTGYLVIRFLKEFYVFLEQCLIDHA